MAYGRESLNAPGQSRTAGITFTSNQLKLIAVIAMVFDHCMVVFMPHEYAAYQFLRMPGKLTAPIMCYLIAEGYDILKAVAKKYEFDNEYPDEKMIELSKKIKVIVDDKSRYTDWSTRDDIKANLQVDLILLLDEYGYPPVTLDDVYKEVLEQAENFKKYAG